MSCEKIAGNILIDCQDLIIAGVGSDLYLVNFDDWQNAVVTTDSTNPLQITGITLASTVLMYKVQNFPNSVRPKFDMSRDVGIRRYLHSVAFNVNKDDVDSKYQVLQILNGKYVAICFTNSQQIEVLGADAGLEASAQTIRDFYAAQGVFTLTLASNEEVLEALPTKSYTGATSPYSFATAKAEILAMVA
jgi:hypothetical protein